MSAEKKQIGLLFGAKPTVFCLVASFLAINSLSVGAQSSLDPVPGTCSELNYHVKNTGVTDAFGTTHPDFWGWTSYRLLINGQSAEDHQQRNYSDLLDSFVVSTFRQGSVVCLRAFNFDIQLMAETSVQRIDWRPLFAPCQACAGEWMSRASFISTHEQKHLVDIQNAVQAANAQWPRSRTFQACEANEAAAAIKLVRAIGTEFGKTGTQLSARIKEDVARLDAQEPYTSMNCASCRCQVPAECKSVQISPSFVRGGVPSNGTVTLLSPAPAGGPAVVLLMSDSLEASVPNQINVSAGASTVTFGVSTVPVQRVRYPFIYASRPGGGTICRAQLTVSPPELINLTTPSTMSGNQQAAGTVTLDSVAPAGGIPVQLRVNNNPQFTYLQIPNTATVPPGALQARFNITALSPPGPTTNQVLAEWGGAILSSNTLVNP